MPTWTRFGSLVIFLPSAVALGHGSMSDPVSRTYNGYLEGPENPVSEAVQDAVDCGGTQPLYDWHEVVNFFPGPADYQRTIPYDKHIPDGRIASGNNEKYFCFDAARDDWPASEISSGMTELTWVAHVVHNPSVFRVWLTTDDWDPINPLNWNQMEELEVGPVALIENEYRFEVDLPERTGRHVLHCIWQRLDPVGEGFYSVSDVIFVDDDGDDDDGGDPDPQGPDSASIALVDAWPESWQGEVTITNSFGDLAMLNWKLEWEEGPEIISLWNATSSQAGDRTIIQNEAWNGYLPAGTSTSFGFIATGAWPPTFSNVTLDGYDIDIEGAPNDDDQECAGDVNLDEIVDVTDMLLVLDAWNSTQPGNPADLDGDGIVNVGDVLLLLESWGTCP